MMPHSTRRPPALWQIRTRRSPRVTRFPAPTGAMPLPGGAPSGTRSADAAAPTLRIATPSSSSPRRSVSAAPPNWPHSPTTAWSWRCSSNPCRGCL